MSSPNSKKLPGVTLLLHLDAFEILLTMQSVHHRQEDVGFFSVNSVNAVWSASQATDKNRN